MGKNISPRIHSVPALMIIKDKNVIFGKQVFDYLLLPSRGKLMIEEESDDKEKGNNNIQSNLSEPGSFSFSSGFSDYFTDIDDTIKENGYNDRNYIWTTLDNSGDVIIKDEIVPEETKTKKATIDLDAYKMQRELELKQNDINTNQLPPPSSTR